MKDQTVEKIANHNDTKSSRPRLHGFISMHHHVFIHLVVTMCLKSVLRQPLPTHHDPADGTIHSLISQNIRQFVGYPSHMVKTYYAKAKEVELDLLIDLDQTPLF